MKDNIDTAIEYYRSSLDINPNKSDCLYNLGNIYCMKENFEEAKICFKKSLALENTNSSAAYNLGNTYYVLN